MSNTIAALVRLFSRCLLTHWSSHAPISTLAHWSSHAPISTLTHWSSHAPISTLTHWSSHAPISTLTHYQHVRSYLRWRTISMCAHIYLGALVSMCAHIYVDALSACALISTATDNTTAQNKNKQINKTLFYSRFSNGALLYQRVYIYRLLYQHIIILKYIYIRIILYQNTVILLACCDGFMLW